MTRNVCHGCREADVAGRLAERRQADRHKPHEVQAAYTTSIMAMPDVPTTGLQFEPNKDRGSALANASAQGAAHGYRQTERCAMASAQSFAAALGSVPGDANAAQAFYDYSRAGFYEHVRGLLRTLDPRPRLAVRRRDGGSRARDNVRARGKANQSLALALRATRHYLQLEAIPLALRMGCSRTQVCHLEAGTNVIQARWVERFAKALEVDLGGLWQFADRLANDDALASDPKAMLRAFYELVLSPATPPASASAPALSPLMLEGQRMAGVAKYEVQPQPQGPRRCPGTGNPFNKAIGRALRFARVRAERDAPEFCPAVGISLTHLYNIETDRKRVNGHHVGNYAAALGLESDRLWSFVDAVEALGDDLDAATIEAAYVEAMTRPVLTPST